MVESTYDFFWMNDKSKENKSTEVDFLSLSAKEGIKKKRCSVCGREILSNDSVCEVCNIKYNFD